MWEQELSEFYQQKNTREKDLHTSFDIETREKGTKPYTIAAFQFKKEVTRKPCYLYD